jgi:hypothetical protein
MVKHTFRDLKDSLSFNISVVASLFVVMISLAVDVVDKIIYGGEYWVRLGAFFIVAVLIILFLGRYLTLAAIEEEISRVQARK